VAAGAGACSHQAASEKDGQLSNGDLSWMLPVRANRVLTTDISVARYHGGQLKLQDW